MNSPELEGESVSAEPQKVDAVSLYTQQNKCIHIPQYTLKIKLQIIEQKYLSYIEDFI